MNLNLKGSLSSSYILPRYIALLDFMFSSYQIIIK